MEIKWLAIIVSGGILWTVIELVRREKLTFKYALSWLVISTAALFFAVFDSLLFRIAHTLGFELPSNFIFFSLLAFFVFLSLFLTIFLCEQNNRNDTIAQKIGILEFEIERLNKLTEDSKKDADSKE
ncbi:MAG TPA: DUF2304 domain-containing protein [Candidatus Omnitrophota bacterium]|nr:DUF2304 domain-containing protein [Candidatus Omnitrophota bacterium]